GWMIQYDDGPYKSLLLAVDDFNKRGGIMGRQIKLITADTKTDPAGSARAGAEVLEQGAQMVVTSCDLDYGGPAALMANNAKVIAFGTCAADPKFGVQGIGRYVFTMATATPGLGALSAEWAHLKKGWNTVYILKDTQVEYTKSVCDNFRERWVEVAGEEAI